MNTSAWHQNESGPAVRRQSSNSNFSWARALGLMGTVILHASLVQTVILGSRVHKVRPPAVQGPGATLIKGASDPTEALVLLTLSVIDGRNKALEEDLTSVGSASMNQIVTMVSPDPLPHIEISKDAIGESSDPVASIDSGDPAARAALFGRYTGQIDARIERIWKRPRSPVNVTDTVGKESTAASAGDRSESPDTFKCQVRIIQDQRGAVQEVQVIDCNGSAEWQQSLVRAIISASPLPAPPSPTVFTHALDMTFESHAYTATSVAEDYEVALR